MTPASDQAYHAPDTTGDTHAVTAGRVQECASVLFRAFDRQRQRRALLDLDDHLLSDIGKSRQEALDEGRKPFWK